MIKYNYEVSVNENRAKLNKDIFLFRGNRNIHYYFSIKGARFTFSKENEDLLESSNAIYAAVTVVKPNGVEVANAIAPVEDGLIHLKVTEDLIDEEVEVGDFDLVFDLFDDNEGAVTIPKIKGQFHVQERPCTTSIGTLSGNVNVVNQAVVDLAIATQENEQLIVVDDDGKYVKTTWVKGDKISIERLNKIEEGIEKNSTQYKDIANNFKLVTGDNNTIKLMFGTKELSSIIINGGTVEPTPNTYTITNTLSNATNSNTATSIEEKSSYSANITVETGYKLDSITVTMGGTDITSSCYSNGNISIEHVTGDIIITVTTSLIPPNTYSVTNTLTQCTSNNNSTTVTEGQSYTATITANTGYTVNSIVVKMGNTDISSSAVSGNIITIANVTGNIVITATATQNALYSFGVMSDIHIPTDETSDTVYGSKYQGITKFTNVINKLKDTDMEFLCVTGDLTTYGNDAQYINASNIINNLNKPFYSCNGNHDMVYNDKNDGRWNNYFGHSMNYVFTKNNDVFIFMSLTTSGTIIDTPYTTNIDWLENQLNNYKNKRVFLFMHLPLTGYAGLKTNEKYGFSDGSTEDERILSLLKQHLNVHCFSGHTHYTFALQEDYPNIIVSKLDYYNISLIHVPSLTQPRNKTGNMTDLSVSNQHLEMFKVDVYEKKIILHAYNVATEKDVYTYEISTDADYTKANSVITSTYNVAINEGQSQTFTVKLEKAPSKNITINLSSASQYVSVSPSTITFTTSNYSTEQTITVNAVDDGTTADYTTLVHLTSSDIPNVDVNIAVTNTTVIEPVVQGYDFSSINSNLTEKFVPNEGYPYVYLSGTDAICSNVKMYSTENAVNNVLGNAGCIGGKFKKYKWNNSTKWTFYKDYDATSSRYYPITKISACSVNIEKATWANNTYTPTGEIALHANISLS